MSTDDQIKDQVKESVEEFKRELSTLLSAYSYDAACDRADFLLAEWLWEQLVMLVHLNTEQNKLSDTAKPQRLEYLGFVAEYYPESNFGKVVQFPSEMLEELNHQIAFRSQLSDPSDRSDLQEQFENAVNKFIDYISKSLNVFVFQLRDHVLVYNQHLRCGVIRSILDRSSFTMFAANSLDDAKIIVDQFLGNLP